MSAQGAGPGGARGQPDLAILAATSGHSGVDRVLTNLVGELARMGLRVDLLAIAGHGPYLEALPPGTTRVELGARHVATALPALVRYLRRYRPAALLSDKDRVNRLALGAARIARVPTRVCVRLGTTVSVNLRSRGPLQRWAQGQSIRRLYPSAHAVLVPSRGVADDLVACYGLRREQVVIVPSPVVTERLAALAAEPVDHPWLAEHDRPVVVGVGELSERKDFATLVRALALLTRRRAVRLILLGEGRRRAQLSALAQELGVSGDLDMPGFRPNPYPIMARADALALTSRWEGMPVVLIEALALGTPVVATDCPSGPREVLRDGRYGPLVPVGNAEALADALHGVLEHPPARSLLREAAAPYGAGASARAYLAAMGFELASRAPAYPGAEAGGTQSR